MKPSFSTSEVARFCHVTADTIRKWAGGGRIRVFKTPGGHRRIRREDLIRFLEENSIPIHDDLIESAAKILIIDADKAVSAMIRRFLERCPTPFQVETAHDAFEAGRALALFRPDVIIVDARLPGLDGTDICQRIRTLPEHARAKLLSLVSAETANQPAAVRGLDGSLITPFSPDDLRRALARVGLEIG
ncbi:MAG: response regulator [Candidatus Hydrogenedentes bacterium]|nr:response regulator [Candidatus Hydrogenedentota bacterium]